MSNCLGIFFEEINMDEEEFNKLKEKLKTCILNMSTLDKRVENEECNIEFFKDSLKRLDELIESKKNDTETYPNDNLNPRVRHNIDFSKMPKEELIVIRDKTRN